MRHNLCQNSHFQRDRRQGQQLQRTVFIIGLKQTLQRQHGRQQRRHPDGPTRNFRQSIRLRPHAEREQDHGNDKKGHDHEAVHALAEGQGEIAFDEFYKFTHARLTPSLVRLRTAYKKNSTRPGFQNPAYLHLRGSTEPPCRRRHDGAEWRLPIV